MSKRRINIDLEQQTLDALKAQAVKLGRSRKKHMEITLAEKSKKK